MPRLMLVNFTRGRCHSVRRSHVRKGSGTRPSGAAWVAGFWSEQKVQLPQRAVGNLSARRPTKNCIWGTGAVAEGNGAGEGDEVARSDIVLGHEGLLQLDNLGEADVGVEVGLDFVEDHDGAVGDR